MIRNPIIIVGCGRSGTTLLYEMLCCHEDLGWFSNLTDKWPSLPVLGFWSKAFPVARRLSVTSRVIPIPSEAYSFWNALCVIDHLPLEDPLTEHDATPQARRLADRKVAALLRYQGRPRFINKATRNTRRLRYVEALFERPGFINIIRDPRATVASLIRAAFWPSITIWSEGNITPREWEQRGKDPAELAAILWASDVAKSLEDKEMIPAERYMEIHYESLIQNPGRTLEEVLAFTGLPMTPRFLKTIRSFNVVDANQKFASQLSMDQLAKISLITGPLAQRLGYLDVGDRHPMP